MVDNLRGVQSIYRLIGALNEELLANEFCNSVTFGELTELDLAKMTLFPLANITLNSVTHADNSLVFDLTIVNVDIVEISKEPVENAIYGNDNLIYIYTNQLFVINKLIGKLDNKTLYNDSWELQGEPRSEFINKEFENMLAGFSTNFQIALPNDTNKC